MKIIINDEEGNDEMLSENLGKLVDTRRLSWGDTIFYTFVFLVHNRKWEKSGKCIASEEKREKHGEGDG